MSVETAGTIFSTDGQSWIMDSYRDRLSKLVTDFDNVRSASQAFSTLMTDCFGEAARDLIQVMQLVERWRQLLVSDAELPKMSELFAVELVVEVCQQSVDKVQLLTETLPVFVADKPPTADQVTTLTKLFEYAIPNTVEKGVAATIPNIPNDFFVSHTSPAFQTAFMVELKKHIEESQQQIWMSLTDHLDRATRLTELVQLKAEYLADRAQEVLAAEK
ncbi:hypothetical protein HD553DRAFT_344557 [Filobasidium floriforme]|uniref:uncharacterized protein n=1 Tax=Filobasidium floriforme TaxID=5210 RepID=UPI001E8EB483|nr:uncharacterized protein HD553DRAFT_344557 [Filobasidium floriforme]KAH8080781.1 hypothetical protein HD553DRAFT_344557 [Filobasidium floriforme]